MSDGDVEIMQKHGKTCFRSHIFYTTEYPEYSELARKLGLSLMVVIVISSINFVIETMPALKEAPKGCPNCEPVPFAVFTNIEFVSMMVFSVEYLSRVLTVHAAVLSDDHAANREMGKMVKGEMNGWAKTFKYITISINLIDLFAILPFYLELIMDQGTGLAVLRLLRLARVFRVLKLAKYNDGFRMFGRVMTQSREALYLLLFFKMLAVVIFGSMIYFAESGTWNEELLEYTLVMEGKHQKSAFTSIPASFWWVIVTSTTVGYGDIVPQTIIGQWIGIVTMFCGILVLALPITVIGSNFSLEYMNSAENLSNKAPSGSIDGDTNNTIKVQGGNRGSIISQMAQIRRNKQLAQLGPKAFEVHVREEIKNLNINEMTPLECQNVLVQIKQKLDATAPAIPTTSSIDSVMPAITLTDDVEPTLSNDSNN